MERLVV